MVASNIRKGASIAGVSGTMLPWTNNYGDYTYYKFKEGAFPSGSRSATAPGRIIAYVIFMRTPDNMQYSVCAGMGIKASSSFYADCSGASLCYNIYDCQFNTNLYNPVEKSICPPDVKISGSNYNTVTLSWPSYGSFSAFSYFSYYFVYLV